MAQYKRGGPAGRRRRKAPRPDAEALTAERARPPARRAPPRGVSARMGNTHTVRFEPVGIEIEVDEDETVLNAAFRQG